MSEGNGRTEAAITTPTGSALEEERCQRRRVVAWLSVIIGLVVAVVIVSAHAAPQARSAEECSIAADMAVVARALSEEAIERAKADAIMARIYDVSTSDRGRALMEAILKVAFSPSAPTAADFAKQLLTMCMHSGGNMDGILGSDV